MYKITGTRAVHLEPVQSPLLSKDEVEIPVRTSWVKRIIGWWK